MLGYPEISLHLEAEPLAVRQYILDSTGSFSVAVVMAHFLLSLQAMQCTWRSKAITSSAVQDGALLTNHKVVILLAFFEGRGDLKVDYLQWFVIRCYNKFVAIDACVEFKDGLKQ